MVGFLLYIYNILSNTMLYYTYKTRQISYLLLNNIEMYQSERHIKIFIEG